MTPLDWWMLAGSTAAGLVSVFRWQILAASHAVRGGRRRLRDVGVDPIARHRLHAGQRPVREPGTLPGPPPPPPPRPLPPSHFLVCGCYFAADSSACPDRIDVTTTFARERRYLHGGPPERGGRPDWVRSVNDGT